MSSEKGFKSIADALAAAEKQQAEKTAAALATRKSHVVRFGPARPAGAAPDATPAKAASPTANPADLRDDFDFAIEFAQTARMSLPRDPAKAETMAVNLLMAKRQIARDQAADLVKRAVRYLDR